VKKRRERGGGRREYLLAGAAEAAKVRRWTRPTRRTLEFINMATTISQGMINGLGLRALGLNKAGTLHQEGNINKLSQPPNQFRFRLAENFHYLSLLQVLILLAEKIYFV